MIDFQRVQITYLGTGVTTLRRVADREDVRMSLITTLGRALPRMLPDQRDKVRAQIAEEVVACLYDHHRYEIFRELPARTHVTCFGPPRWDAPAVTCQTAAEPPPANPPGKSPDTAKG